MKNKNMIFFLGGYDLEMITIKEILEQNCIKFIDKNLLWGAKLSDYNDELKKYTNYTIYGIELELDIDAPNNYIEIDHHNKNNNKPSSIEQVAKILDIKLDRYQQLVSANDSGYIPAMKKINATSKEINNIRLLDRQAQGITKKDEHLAMKTLENNNSNIIYSYTQHFSSIADRVYNKYKNYIIYNDTKIVFYSYKLDNILKFLENNNIKKDDYYYGGGNFGFVAIKENILSKEAIKKLIKEFDMHSYHIFILPFRYKNKNDISKDWIKKEYKTTYNQEVFFHKFFNDSMFKEMEYFEYDKYQDSSLIIKKSQEYSLLFKKATLRLFEHLKIGLLSFHIKNDEYYDIKSVLEINDYTRRLYPEYLDYENKKSGLVPDFIKLGDIEENFKFDENLKEPKISKIIKEFLPNLTKDDIVVDDRMFTISFYKNSQIASDLQDNYTKNDSWYEYVFVDGNGKNIHDNKMQEELIQKATYTRWKDYGTMYGVSRYSFVCLADSDFVLKDMKLLYYDIFSLLLLVRATVLKFSNEVSNIANNIEDKNTADKVNNLYNNYIQFVNKYYFREITAKDQGLELYEMSMNIFQIQRDIKDLDSEIEELHKFVEIQQEKATTKTMDTLTYIGGALLLPSIVTGFYGMNGDLPFNEYSVYISLVSFLIIPGYLFTKKLKENHE